MSNTANQMPPPPPGGVSDVQPDTKERVLSTIGGILTQGSGRKANAPQLDEAIARHHQQRLDDARMHRQNAATYAGVLATGTDPKTGAPLTPEQEAQYQNWYNSAWAAYEKAAGVDKNTKGALQKAKTLADYVIHLGRTKRVAASPTAPGARPGGPPAPPAASATATAPGVGLPGGPEGQGAPMTGPPPPPPGVGESAQGKPPAPPRPYNSQVALATQVTAGADAEFAEWKRRQAVLRDNKIDEEKALEVAKLQGGGGAAPRPVFSRPIGVLDARTLAQQGKSFTGEDGEPIDLTALPDTMALTPYVTRIGGQWMTRYIPVSPNQQTVTVGNETYAVSPYDKTKMVTGQAGTDIGAHTVPGTTRTTDPATGQTMTATHTPTTTGMRGRPPVAGAAATGKPPTAPAAPAAPGAAPPAATTQSKAPAPSGALPPLDADGHIPPVALPGATPQVVEGANRLLDGIDAEKLPTKTRMLSESLARRYGWEQGKFTPKEQVMLREATTFLQQALTDSKGNPNPVLNVLDEGYFDRMKIGQALQIPDKEGIIGRAATTLSAMNLTDQQAAYVRMYNQLVGTISGLGQLVRTGRATEATIDRLKAELPNPTTTQGSADARKRIQRLLREIDVALTKGSFTGTAAAPAKKGGPPAPPGASPGANGTSAPGGKSSLDDDIMAAVKAAKGGH